MNESASSETSTTPKPCVIPLSEIPVVDPQDAPTKVRISRVITKKRCGSNLLLGAAWMDPGESTNVWSSQQDPDTDQTDHQYGFVHECYFIITGQLELSWDEGVLSCGPNDTVYLAPGWTYSLKNVGSDAAFFVYAMTPSPE